MAIGMAIAAGVGLVKLGVGIAQRRKGKKLEEATERPDYEIPAEVFQNLSQAQQMALQGLPAEQKAQYLQNLQQSGQFALSQSGSRKAGLTGIGQMQQQQQLGFQDLLARDSAARQQNQMQVMQQRQNVAGYRDQAFQLNQLNPFYEDVAQARGLQSAGMQNIFTGFENAAYSGGQFAEGFQGVGGAGRRAGRDMAGQVLNANMGIGGQVGGAAGTRIGGIGGVGGADATGAAGATAGATAVGGYFGLGGISRPNQSIQPPRRINQFPKSPVQFNYQ